MRCLILMKSKATVIFEISQASRDLYIIFLCGHESSGHRRPCRHRVITQEEHSWLQLQFNKKDIEYKQASLPRPDKTVAVWCLYRHLQHEWADKLMAGDFWNLTLTGIARFIYIIIFFSCVVMTQMGTGDRVGIRRLPREDVDCSYNLMKKILSTSKPVCIRLIKQWPFGACTGTIQTQPDILTIILHWVVPVKQLTVPVRCLQGPCWNMTVLFQQKNCIATAQS